MADTEQGSALESSRALSSASFAVSEARSEGPEPNGFPPAGPAPPSTAKLSEELARRLGLADSNPSQPQASACALPARH